MKKTILILLTLILLPLSAFADDATSTASTSTPSAAPETITVNVNVRYQSGLIFNAPVTVTKSSITSAVDSDGLPHQLASDSALAALIAADNASLDFSISNLSYYSDFGAFYLKCINIASVEKNACDNWQYVVNSTYPPTGSDHYTLSNGDTLYFYFGSPRRLSLDSAKAEQSATVTVKTEKYDYTNDSWQPLSGASVGATQPNPSDPYSPTVIATATSDDNGIAHLSLSTPGNYGVGLAMDYYAWLEPLEIVAPAPEPASESRVSRSGSGSSRLLAAASAIAASSTEAVATTTVIATTTEPVVAPVIDSIDAISATTPGEVTIALDIPTTEFAAKFKAAYENALSHSSSLNLYMVRKEMAKIEKETALSASESQTASVVESFATSTVSTTSPRGRGLFKSILGIFGL